MQNMMQNMNQQMQMMNTTQQNQLHNLNNINRNLNTNINQFLDINSSNLNNMRHYNMNQGNNSISTNIRYDPINRATIVTINRNGVISTHNIRDSENSNFQIDQLINAGILPNEELVNSLPEREITQADLQAINEQKSCIICLNEFALREMVITLPCLHIFHTNCIKPWLNSRDDCPICKHNIND